MLNGIIHQLNNCGLLLLTTAQAIFYILAGLAILFAFMVVSCRNIFHSAIYLALTLIAVAGIYLYLGAEFIAVAQVLIYVGAIVTLFIFAVMLTSRVETIAVAEKHYHVLIAGLVSLAFLFLLFNLAGRGEWVVSAGEGAAVFNLNHLGRELMTTYALPFEVLSMIILAALVGAVVIGKAKK